MPATVAVAGGWLFFASGEAVASVQRAVGISLLAIGGLALGLLLLQTRRPRVAYADGNVLFYLRRGAPLAVPVEIVEAFFAGQGPAHLPAVTDQRTVNLVARLAQRHTEWAERDVKTALGNWEDGYVTIRGSWCEPLDSELIRRLNRRLKEVKTQAGTVATAPASK
ncbi:MAG: hypothetical protein U0805_11825 [Pirellulales bacterium]